MMRNSLRSIVRNRSGYWAASSSRSGNQHDLLSPLAPSTHGPSSDPAFSNLCDQTGHEKSLDRNLQLNSRGVVPDPHFLPRAAPVVKIFDSSSKRYQSFWSESFKGSPILGRNGEGIRSTSRWNSVSVWKCSEQNYRRLDPWTSTIVRTLSTSVKVDDSQKKSSEEAKAADAAPRPKRLEDFKHEEIEGPTVERDLSDTANQVRESLGELTVFMGKLSTGFVVAGGVQLLAAVWSSYFHNVGIFFSTAQGLGVLMSFILAYLLRHFKSSIEFFSMMEGRSRLRVLTLSLQVIKAIALLFFRSDFVVKFLAGGSLLALLGYAWHFHSIVS